MEATQALEFLETLSINYHQLAGQHDLELMPPRRLDLLIEQNRPAGPYIQAAWFGRMGSILSVWSLWEYYSRVCCERLPKPVKRHRRDSCVAWVGQSLQANDIPFRAEPWFTAANTLRNLITHYNGRVVDRKAEKMLADVRAFTAFSNMDLFADHYVNIQTEHVSGYFWEIEEFIRDTAEFIPES